MMGEHDQLQADIVGCYRCPRLVAWREEVGRTRKRAYRDQTYWSLPVPNFCDAEGDRLIVGLAPAAHGGNRTGRVFTGDRSGDWLFAALYRAGLANQPTSERADDGLTLHGAFITAAVHCAPPGNKPLPSEYSNCREYLVRTLELRPWRAILCLGAIAWTHTLGVLGEPSRPVFAHGATYRTPSGVLVVGSYHPSQQNTFTGKLTEEMFDQAIRRWLEG